MDKVYLVIWFWYAVLLIFGLLRLLLRLVLLLVCLLCWLVHTVALQGWPGVSTLPLPPHEGEDAPLLQAGAGPGQHPGLPGRVQYRGLVRSLTALNASYRLDYRFVLYQMSKNMNRRLFFMFITRLARVPRAAVLQQFLAPLQQIRVVQAFQSSVKHRKPKPEDKKDEEKKKEEKVDAADTDLAKVLAGLKQGESPVKANEDKEGTEDGGCPRQRQVSEEDDDGEEICLRKHQYRKVSEEPKVKQKTSVISEADSQPSINKTRVAFEQSFGKRLRK